MQFTEAELTAVMTSVAKATLTAQSKDIRKGRLDIDQVWTDLGGYGRYQLLEGLSGQVLPALAALPEVPRVHGERRRFKGSAIRAAVEATLGGEAGTGLRRKTFVVGLATLIAPALADLPVWHDPERTGG
jgi:hypothetical protein